jgi:hypothetical protein
MWRGLGLQFQEIELVEEGLSILLDWSAGVEIVSPTAEGGTEAERFRTFLKDQGEGVWSVVVKTEAFEDAIRLAEEHGATVRYRQRRGGEGMGFTIDEADLVPVFGMPVTLLATDLPD